MILEKVYDELMAQIEDLKKAVAAMSGGSDDYDVLSNRPKVNNITLTGNKKSSDLKIAYSMTEAEYAAVSKNAESIYCLQENASSYEEVKHVLLEVADWVLDDDTYTQSKTYTMSDPTPVDGWGVGDISSVSTLVELSDYSIGHDPESITLTFTSDTLPEYGITTDVNITVTQPAGSTRIMKNGLQFGGYRYDVLFTSTGTESSYELSHPYTDYDIIVCIGKYSGATPTDSRLCRMIPTAVLAAGTSSTNWEISSESDYLWFTVTDATHFARGAIDDIKMYQIAGIKF